MWDLCESNSKKNPGQWAVEKQLHGIIYHLDWKLILGESLTVATTRWGNWEEGHFS